MTTQSKMRLQRFHEAPHQMPSTQYRSFVFTNYAFLMAGSIHLLFIGLFVLLQVPILALYNILSVGIWGLALNLNLKGKVVTANALGNLEVLFHALLCTVVIGWESGFHYYILAIPLTIFLHFWPTWFKFLSCTLNLFIYVMLSAYANSHPPAIPLDPVHVHWLNYMNLIGIIVAIAWVAYFFSFVVDRIENRLKLEQQRTAEALAERNQALDRIQADLTDAARYVRSALPSPITTGDIRVDWKFFPSASLGGDAFGYHWLSEEHFAIYLIDVSGHGVGAALLSISIMNMLKSGALATAVLLKPESVLTTLNQRFPGAKTDEMFFTMWYGVYNRNTRQMDFASGGHPPAIMFNLSSGDKIRPVKLHTPNFVVGGRKNVDYRQSQQSLPTSSDLYVFSDGAYEFFHQNGKIWRYGEFVDVLKGLHEHNNGLDHLIHLTRGLCRKDGYDDDFTILKVSFE